MSIPPFSNMSFVTTLSGSTGANMYKNITNRKWIVKRSKKGAGGFEQVKIESITDDIYQALDIPVPIHFLDVDNKALILEYIDGIELAKASATKQVIAKKELQKGFIVDALLANWDVIGLLEDNILLPKDGSPAVRIDNGGSLIFRAQGNKKPFNKVVNEIDTMRNKQINPSAAKIFGDLTDTDIDTQIKTIIVPNYDLILSKIPNELKPVMKDRMDNLIERTVWTNASAFKNTVKETSQSQFIPYVEVALVKYFMAGWMKNFKNINVGPVNNSDRKRLIEFINKILKDNDAIISGGFILKAIGSFVDEKSVDIDIYVPTVNAEEFRRIMTNLFDSTTVVKHVVSDSPGSFFKKNGIVSVSKYSKSLPKYAEMDIVEVNEDRTPIDVIKNSDLTFCENWYDGENVWMTYPEHVKTKAGFLENHYLNILFTGNPALIGRMKKYINRGFKISINNPVTKKVENVTNGIKNGKLFQQQIQTLTNVVPKNTHYGSYGTTGYSPSSAIPLNNISNIIIQPSKNDLLNMSITNGYPNTPVTNFSTNFSSLTSVEINAVKHYTGTGFLAVNKFLYTDTPIVSDYSLIYNGIRAKFPKNVDESDDEYGKRVTYYYFINLYNAIQKVPTIGDKPVKLYRGTKTWYLPENTDKFYYLNSFSSTSFSPKTIHSFGLYFDATTKLQLQRAYIFYVHPKCNFMNVRQISSYKSENEVILNPYHRYIYLNETKSADGIVTYRNYSIFPTDIDIPTTYDTFMPWKNRITHMSTIISNGVAIPPVLPLAVPVAEELGLSEKKPVKELKGGKLQVQLPKVSPIYRYKALEKMRARTNKKLKSLSLPIKGKKPFSIKMQTRKANNSKMSVADKNTLRKFTDPLPSFPGKAPTAKEMNIIQKMRELIKNDTK